MADDVEVEADVRTSESEFDRQSDAGLLVPPAARLPAEAAAVRGSGAHEGSVAPTMRSSDPPRRESGQPPARPSLVPLPEGYTPPKRSSIPPGRLQPGAQGSDAPRRRLSSDPGAGRQSTPHDLASTIPEAGLLHAASNSFGAAADPGVARPAPGPVVTPMRIIEVKKSPPSGQLPPVPPPAPALVAPVKPALPFGDGTPTPSGDAHAPGADAQLPGAQLHGAGAQLHGAGAQLHGAGAQLHGAGAQLHGTQARGVDAPTPPDTPHARSSDRVPAAEAPTPPETPALRRELLSRISGAEEAASPKPELVAPVDAPAPVSLGQRPPPAPRRTPKVDEGADDIEVTFDAGESLEIPDEELTEVEAVSEPAPDVQHKRRRLPPRPPPRTAFSDGTGVEDGKKRLWWQELWNDDFLRAEVPIKPEQLQDEVDFIDESLAIERGGVVLDLACGAGGYSVELSRRGYAVVGYDLSVSQLARAGELAQRYDQKISFLQGDAREMSFEQMFDGVFCWNASFGFFEEEKNQVLLGNVFRALKPGGAFLLDVPNRDYLVRQQPMQSWFEGDNCVCMDDMHVDFITSRLMVKRTVMLDDGRNREWHYSLRIYALHELGKMLHDQGFRVAQVSGQVATPAAFLGSHSPRIIILAIKPNDEAAA